MKSRLTLLMLSITVIASMLLTACGAEPTPTTVPAVATNTTAPAAATNTTAPAAATNTTAPAAATNTTAPAAEATNTTAAAAAPTDTAAPEAAATETPKPLATAKAGEKVLRLNMGAENDTNDPQKMSFVNEIGWGQLVFEALLELDKDNVPVPAAAEKVDVSADGTVYTVTLKKGLTYSDGTPLTAHNFDYAFHRLFDPRVTNRNYASVAYIIKGSQELSELADTSDNAKVEEMMSALGVKATSDDTIEFTLNTAAAYFPYILSIWVGWPTRQDMVEKGGETWTEPATYIGNGPYILTDWAHGNGAAFEANPTYRKGQAKIDRIEFRQINESQIAFQAYRQGELDVTAVAPEDLATVKGDATLSSEYIEVPGSCVFYLGFNVQKAPFDNIEVRQAFARAFDRDDYVEVILKGLGIPAYSFIPPDRPGYAEDIRQPDFNAEEAKTMLDEVVAADYGGTLPPIKLTYSSSTRNTQRMEWVQNQIKTNLGIDAQLEPVEAKAYTALVKEPETTPQFFFLGWCQDYPDPQDFLTLVFRSDSTVTHVGWKNEQFDTLVSQADIEPDSTKRLDLYHQAHEILAEEAPVIFLYYDVNPLLIKPYVTGMKEAADPTDALVPGYKDLVNLDIQK